MKLDGDIVSTEEDAIRHLRRIGVRLKEARENAAAAANNGEVSARQPATLNRTGQIPVACEQCDDGLLPTTSRLIASYTYGAPTFIVTLFWPAITAHSLV
uniref:Uncharacterized protein n=1 Tax=Plectus sambesii TaxID=2011161 RepID=A0A914X4J6_9BILA